MARSGPVPARRDELVDQRPSRTQHVTNIVTCTGTYQLVAC